MQPLCVAIATAAPPHGGGPEPLLYRSGTVAGDAGGAIGVSLSGSSELVGSDDVQIVEARWLVAERSQTSSELCGFR